MKKISAILLCVAIVFPCICISVGAEKNYTFYMVNIDSGSGAVYEKAIVLDGEIYINAKSFSKYTRFSFHEDKNTFLINGQELSKAFKSVVIDLEKNRALISGKKFVDLSDCIETEGELYLPFCQMLPLLNAEIYEIKGSTIYISNNKLSLAEVLYDFDISDYYFNLSAEFCDKSWAAVLAILPNYIFDTVVNIRFDRLDIVYNSGEYNDYKEAFSSFLSEDDLYLKAYAKDNSIANVVVDFLNEINEPAKNMHDAYDWVKIAGESDLLPESGDDLLEILKAYYDVGEHTIDELKLITDAWDDSNISLGDCIDLISYFYTFATLISDNKQMLDSVYDVDSKISKKETSRKAAKQVYDLYGNSVEPALFEEVSMFLGRKIFENFNPFSLYTTTAKVAGTVLETVLPFSPKEIARLPIYSDIVLSAASKFYSYDTTSDESTENLRLSLLLCMIASKKCFEVMGDIIEQDEAYYKDKVTQIEFIIMGLYICADNTKFDSFEHFEDHKNNNLKKIKDSKILDKLKKNQLTEAEALTVAKELIAYYENYYNYGTSCSLNFETPPSQEEFDAVLSLSVFSDSPEAHLLDVFKCSCCKTFEQSKKHMLSFIDQSLLNDISDNCVEYSGNLYYITGNKGYVTYENVTIKEFNNERIIAFADCHGSGGDYCSTYKFTITKATNYKISDVTEDGNKFI